MAGRDGRRVDLVEDHRNAKPREFANRRWRYHADHVWDHDRPNARDSAGRAICADGLGVAWQRPWRGAQRDEADPAVEVTNQGLVVTKINRSGQAHQKVTFGRVADLFTGTLADGLEPWTFWKLIGPATVFGPLLRAVITANAPQARITAAPTATRTWRGWRSDRARSTAAKAASPATARGCDVAPDSTSSSVRSATSPP